MRSFNLTRRRVVGVGAAGVIGLNASICGAQTAQSNFKATVTYAGKTFEFTEENGEDLGDFVSTVGKFTQRCIRCEVADFPLTVFFRPDRDSERVEVVFELGRIFSAAPYDLGAYEVTISRGATVLTRIDVPVQYWFSRWRWQSSPRPVVGNVAALLQQNLIPPYSRSPAMEAPKPIPLTNGGYVDPAVLTQFAAGNYDAASKMFNSAQQGISQDATAAIAVGPSAGLYTVMGLAGVAPYMPGTGERADIGLVTESQADYICTGDQSALESLRAQAEAAGTMPWHMRDDSQTAPFNFRRHPGAQWYGPSGGAPHVKVTATPITIDSAHQPSLAYVPYLLTGDPYHLEDLQFQATWNWGSLPAAYRPSIPQARTFAWNIRTLAQAARVTPDATPSWLLPQSYWADLLAEHREFFHAECVENIRPERLLFRATANIDSGRGEANAPEGTWVDPWQDEFVAAVLGWMVLMGFAEWRASFEWIIGGTIARTGTTSGWVRAHATPYRLILRPTKTSPFAGSWREAWSLQETIAKATYSDPNSWVEGDMTYLAYSRGALVFAEILGVAGATENLAWATNQLKGRNWKTANKWRLGQVS